MNLISGTDFCATSFEYIRRLESKSNYLSNAKSLQKPKSARNRLTTLANVNSKSSRIYGSLHDIKLNPYTYLYF